MSCILLPIHFPLTLSQALIWLLCSRKKELPGSLPDSRNKSEDKLRAALFFEMHTSSQSTCSSHVRFSSEHYIWKLPCTKHRKVVVIQSRCTDTHSQPHTCSACVQHRDICYLQPLGLCLLKMPGWFFQINALLPIEVLTFSEFLFQRFLH